MIVTNGGTLDAKVLSNDNVILQNLWVHLQMNDNDMI
jgi:hypothetical protein